MRTGLIGSTGFIGGNLSRQYLFDECYHSMNISSIRGREFGLLVCGGLSAVKWQANRNPEEDRARIDSLLGELTTVRAGRVVVLSTVDVYPVTRDVDETFDCHSQPNHAYGTNRLYFEERMRGQFGDITVVRISGVFGPGLKKNVIYDLLHDNCLDSINPDSAFQYYDVSNLWRDLSWLEQAGIRLINLASEPIYTRDLIDRFFPGKVVGQSAGPPISYNVRTVHSPAHYLSLAGELMRELGVFVDSVRNEVPA
jgi:hypothetical protein